MAERIDPKSYGNMITALNNFATKTGETCDQLYAAAETCQSQLGEQDPATSGMASNNQTIATTYKLLAERAKSIATRMQQELDETYAKDQDIWNSDSDSGDDF